MMHTFIYSQACKCCIMNTSVMNRCCANSHMSFPWLALTPRTFLYTCMCSQEYINSPRNVDNSIEHTCVFMYLFICLSIYLFIYLLHVWNIVTDIQSEPQKILQFVHLSHCRTTERLSWNDHMYTWYVQKRGPHSWLVDHRSKNLVHQKDIKGTLTCHHS